MGTQTKVFCISGPNLVILAWLGDELSCGQASDWYTHTQTHRPTDQAMTIPEGQNWPRVKIYLKKVIESHPYRNYSNIPLTKRANQLVSKREQFILLLGRATLPIEHWDLKTVSVSLHGPNSMPAIRAAWGNKCGQPLKNGLNSHTCPQWIAAHSWCTTNYLIFPQVYSSD